MRANDATTAVAQSLAALDRYGLFMFSDAALPSLVGMIVGQPLRGSWWGHPRGKVIYYAMKSLEDVPDVLSAKLIAGKVTYVHRRLWPALLAVGTARQHWQLNGLSNAALWLLQTIDTDGEVQTNDLPPPPPDIGLVRKRVPDLARELERHLLVHAREIHTPSGAHAKVLQSWRRWAASVQITPDFVYPADGQRALEDAADRLAAGVPGGVARLPWR